MAILTPDLNVEVYNADYRAPPQIPWHVTASRAIGRRRKPGWPWFASPSSRGSATRSGMRLCWSEFDPLRGGPGSSTAGSLTSVLQSPVG